MTASKKTPKSHKESSHDSTPTLAGAARRFLSYFNKFASFFESKQHHARHYFKGLMQADKKNMERMEERIPGACEQGLQYFISDSKWDEEPLLNKIAVEADHFLGGKEDSALYLDETGIPKKGEKSVGVARQWCGQLGKVDNCQVGVFSTLGNGTFATPIGYKLYLPKEWTDDKKRCQEAKIPSEHWVEKSKHDLALELIKDARGKRVRFNWIGADGFYGKNPKFLREIDALGETFVIDVHKDQHIYLADPAPIVVPAKSKKGRKPSRLQAQTESIRVDIWVASLPKEQWQRLQLRKTTKGYLVVDVLHSYIWVWDGEEKTTQKWRLIVRREVNSPDKIKYSLSNATEEISIARLAYMQAQRYWIERTFQDSKTHCGMGDYQMRGWYGWHHHMAMVLMAMLFLLQERLAHKETVNLLSCTDIVELLKLLLPRRDVTEEEVLRQLQVRHAKRQASIDYAYKKQHDNQMLERAEGLTK
jgi:SRSO17 transposase